MNVINTVSRNPVTCSLELEISVSHNKTLWCSIYFIPVSEDGKLHTIVGCLENIDAEKNG